MHPSLRDESFQYLLNVLEFPHETSTMLTWFIKSILAPPSWKSEVFKNVQTEVSPCHFLIKFLMEIIRGFHYLKFLTWYEVQIKLTLGIFLDK